MSNIERDDLTARLLRHRTAELEEYKRAALSRDMSPEFVAEFKALKQQLAGAVALMREAAELLETIGTDDYVNPQTAEDMQRVAADLRLALAGPVVTTVPTT